MTKTLKDCGWCKVLERGGVYFLSYDAGGIAIQMKEIQVTKPQAERAMKDQYEAEKVVSEIVDQS